MNDLAAAQIAGQARLRDLARTGVERAWTALPGYDEANVPEFLGRAVPVVLAAQRQSAVLTNAYLARRLRRQPFPLRVGDVVGSGVRAGVPPQEVYRRPFVTVWTALKAGTKFEDAVASGLARATGMAAMDVQLTQRATLGAVQADDEQILGYRRTADAGACEFCQAVDGAKVLSADAMPLHNGCGCTLEPILDTFTVSGRPDTVAVHDHGELGLVLGAPGDHFTQL